MQLPDQAPADSPSARSQKGNERANGDPSNLPVPDSPHFTCFHGKGTRLVEGGPIPGDTYFARTLELIIGRPILGGNDIEELINGTEFFPVMLDLIRGARRSVTVELYIWESGKISDRFIEALTERARAGVKIHILADGFGSVKLQRKDIEQLLAANVHFVYYKRSRRWKVRLDINHRTHRKILVVDGRAAITGGLSISDDWAGDANSESSWRDNGYLVRGPMVNQMQAVFADNWLGTTRQLLWGDDYFPELSVAASKPGHFYGSHPGRRYAPARLSLFLALACASKRIRIGHAYFVPDAESIELLLSARKRGVEVEVILPKHSDSALGRAVSRSRLQPLLEAGVRIYRFEPAMFHCKFVVVDEIVVFAGSTNLDPRSFHMLDEADFTVIDASFAATHARIFEEDRECSVLYTLEDHNRRPLHLKLLDWFMGFFWWLF